MVGSLIQISVLFQDFTKYLQRFINFGLINNQWGHEADGAGATVKDKQAFFKAAGMRGPKPFF